jgi:site-specific DNA-methyltransferase (adenine-specific)
MRPYYEADGITLYCGDCRAVLAETTGDVIATDPPYGTGGWRRAASGQGANCRGTLEREPWDSGALEWLAMCEDVAAVLTFWPAAKTGALLAAASAWPKHRALYMRKRDPKPMVNGRTAWSVEPIWCLSRNGFVLAGGTDCLDVSTPRLGRDADGTGHPYQKPIEVMTWLLAKLPPRMSILDPFAGTGTTLLAAKQLGRRAVGIELSEEWCAVAVERLAQRELPFAARY